jgi:primary-amine oxidase
MAKMDAHPAHPLSTLSIDETNKARDVIVNAHPNTVIDFRWISLQEPAKAELVPFLDLEHAGKLQPDTPRPPRLARLHYDIIDGSKVPKYCESIVDVAKGEQISHQVVDGEFHACLTMYV